MSLLVANQYLEPTFIKYVNTELQSQTMTAQDRLEGPGVMTIKAVSAGTKALEAKSIAVRNFLNGSTQKPEHLDNLFKTLRQLRVAAESAAEFCLKVEGYRIASHRTSTSPLIDRKAPSDATFAEWWSDIALDLDPADILEGSCDRVSNVTLPLYEKGSERIAMIVFGGFGPVRAASGPDSLS